MATVAFPTWAYNLTQSAQLVQTQAALTALGSSWTTTPFAPPGQIAPTDPGFTDTDIRLQQLLVEARITNQYLFANGSGIPLTMFDEPTLVRTDIVTNDVALTS